ncbi:MAG: hypothetical protein JJ992_14050, partial [Planctomycetes bacterium]|nr:hypothetical protein [Planctomycetota bacterium]
MSVGGAATVDVNADVDPLIGAIALNFGGSADATVNLNAGTVTADLIGLQAINLAGTGGQAVVTTAAGTLVDVGDDGATPLAVGVGALEIGENGTFAAGTQGGVTIDVQGDVNVNKTDDFRFGVAGASLFGEGDVNINVAGNVDANDATDSSVGFGIVAAKLEGAGDVIITTEAGSSVDADHVAIAAVAGTTGAVDNNIIISNAGALSNDFDVFGNPTVFGLADGAVTITNEATGSIQGSGNDTDLIVVALSDNNTVTLNNHGAMTGTVFLAAGDATVTTNSGVWDTAGVNVFAGVNSNTLTNDGTIIATGTPIGGGADLTAFL